MNDYKKNMPIIQEVPVEAQREEDTIDLLELAYVLLGKIKYIILVALLGAVIVNGGTYLTQDPTYESTATLYVVSASSGGVVDLTDLSIGTNLKEDYKVLIQRYPVLNRTIDELNLDMSADQLRNMMSINNPTDTRIITITVTSTDRTQARDIANKLAEVSTEYLPEIMNADAPNIAEEARIADHKSGPSYSKATMMGGLLGMLLACGYFIIMFLMDTTIKSEEDIEKLTGEMPLATIPYSKSMDSKSSEFEAAIDPVPEEDKGKGRITVHIPKLPYAAEEEINRLQVNISFSGGSIKTVMLTSSIANEGKSSVSVNLWRKLAESGARVALVDLDLRNSVFKDVLRYEYDQEEYKGIDYYLSGHAKLNEVVYETNIPNGYLIPCTHTLNNPASLLQDRRLVRMLDGLKKVFDYIIVDTAPVLLTADGEMISNLTDAAVMVVRSGVTRKDDVRKSIMLFERGNCQMLGTVLNAVNMEKKAYGGYGGYGRYGRYGGYGYGGYGYGQGDKKSKKRGKKRKK